MERELAVLIERLTAVQRQEDIASPTPYRLLRAVLWSGAREPAGDKQDKTRLPPPPPHQLKKVASPVGDSAQKEVIRETEELFRTYPLWIDLQVRVVRALDSLGAREAGDAICRELSGLLSRLPGLSKLKFSSGTPFASEETLLWLSGECARRAGAVSTAVAGPGTPVSSVPPPAPTASAPATPVVSAPVTIAYAPVEIPRGLTSLDDEEPVPEALGAALVVLHNRELRSGSPRRRFELRLQMADACLKHSRIDLAGPLVDVLTKDMETHRLEQWDPELAVLVLRQKLSVERARPTGEEGRRLRSDLWGRICLLNPAEAVALGSET